jgi:hypothetical protein
MKERRLRLTAAHFWKKSREKIRALHGANLRVRFYDIRAETVPQESLFLT